MAVVSNNGLRKGAAKASSPLLLRRAVNALKFIKHVHTYFL